MEMATAEVGTTRRTSPATRICWLQLLIAVRPLQVETLGLLRLLAGDFDAITSCGAVPESALKRWRSPPLGVNAFRR
jgi:hypothetical protein